MRASPAPLALLVAIFVSNLPESLVGAVAMRRGGLPGVTLVGIWAATAAVLTAAVVLGYGALSLVSPSTLAFPLAIAGGAVLASLADRLMPEAFEHGRPLNSFATGAGFVLSFVLAELGGRRADDRRRRPRSRPASVRELICAYREEEDGEGEEEDDLHAHRVPNRHAAQSGTRRPPGRAILAKRRSDPSAIRPAMDGDTVEGRAQFTPRGCACFRHRRLGLQGYGR